MTRYLVDSNVFIQAKNFHYGFDFCPAFWDWLVRENRDGKVASVEQVAQEIMDGDDNLVDWANEYRNDFFLKPDGNVLKALTNVNDRLIKLNYEPGALSIFMGGADCWLIAHAMVHNYSVVTHEKPARSVKKIKIPNICVEFDLSFMTPFDMLRQERARFILETV